MLKNKFRIPKGMSDILFDECYAKRKIERNLSSLYRELGYREVITPTVEYMDVYQNAEIDIENSYKMIDGKGDIQLLRPDNTVPIARIVGNRLENEKLPLKLFYNQNIFSLNKINYGKKDESTQNGVELIGDNSIKSDIDIIITAIKAIKKCNINKFVLEIGHVGIFKELCSGINFHNEDFEKVREYIENKNFAALNDLMSQYENSAYVTALKKLPELFGSSETFETAYNVLKNTSAVKYLDYIKEIYDIIKGLGIADKIHIDLGLINEINYYTGIVFRCYADDFGDYFLSGGRYDNLIEKFGKPLPAIGFAIDIDFFCKIIMSEFMEKNEYNIDYVIFYEKGKEKQGYEKYFDLISKGYKVFISYKDTVKDTKMLCKDMNCNKLIIINEETKEVTL